MVRLALSRSLAALPMVERNTLTWLHRGVRYPLLRALLRLVSRLGNGVLWYAIIAALPVIHGADRGSRLAVQMLVTGLVCLLIYRWLKRWASRPRPHEVMPAIQPAAMALDRYSFPSGHTLHATAFSLVLMAHDVTWAWFVIPFSLLVALSRPVLGLHYPGDVLAGAALGALVASSLPWVIT